VLQVGGSESRDGNEVPVWWWAVTLVVLAAGVAVWSLRRLRRRAARQGDVSSDLAHAALQRLGLVVHAPAGNWVRQLAPTAFLPEAAVIGPTLWPWAGVDRRDARTVLVARQHGQVRTKTGLTTGRTRTVAVAQQAGTRLPRVFVTGREGVPPHELPRAIALELEDFNRALWAWGPDAAGLYAVLHPRSMALTLRGLPDGASVIFAGDAIAVFSDEAVHPHELAAHLELAVRLMDLAPSFLSS
jgi:hypothetical protein